MRGMRKPSCRLLRMWRKARAASLFMLEAAEGLIRFQALRTSVSGTSSES